jgi:ABC-type phosphonate transport system ATPase subunit
MIGAEELTKRRGGRAIVSDVTVRYEPGTVTGFLVPHGAGKTTTWWSSAAAGSRQGIRAELVADFGTVVEADDLAGLDAALHSPGLAIHSVDGDRRLVQAEPEVVARLAMANDGLLRRLAPAASPTRRRGWTPASPSPHCTTRSWARPSGRTPEPR